MHLPTIYSRCRTDSLIYIFSTPENPSTQIYGLWGDPPGREAPAARRGPCPDQVSSSVLGKAGRSPARSLPLLCQKDCEPATCSFQLLARGFPTLNSFSSEVISKFWGFFPLYVIKPWRNKGKNQESGERPWWKVPEGKGDGGGTYQMAVVCWQLRKNHLCRKRQCFCLIQIQTERARPRHPLPLLNGKSCPPAVSVSIFP